MSLAVFADWLDQSSVSQGIKNAGVIIPLAQSVHILAVAFVLSGALLTILRSTGRLGALGPVAAWSAPLLRRTRLALVLLALTGGLLVLAEPTRELVNRTFQIKLLAVAITVPLALWQGRALLATPAGQLPALAWRWRGVGVFVLWVLIVIAGRWIAYS